MTVTREPVQPTKRRPMTRARRTRIWLRDKGLCGNCGAPVPCRGTTIDHRIAIWLGGADEDDNLRFMCTACDQPKTSQDKGVIAHVKRLIANENPETRRKGKRPIQSAGFPTHLTKGFDRVVRPRKAHNGASR